MHVPMNQDDLVICIHSERRQLLVGRNCNPPFSILQLLTYPPLDLEVIGIIHIFEILQKQCLIS